MDFLRLVLFFFCLSPLSIFSQVVISPKLSNTSVFNLNQLLNVQLINVGVESVRGIVDVQIEDQSTQTIFQIQSLPFELLHGQTLDASQINWEGRLQFGEKELSRMLAQSGRLPTNQYVYCYRFLDIQVGRVLGSFCQEQTYQNFQLPQLAFPSNNATLQNPFPLLSWYPPMPISGIDLTYSLRLVEIVNGLSPQEAINRQIPLLEKHNLKGLTHPYPVTAIPLKKDKIYAWQVVAYSAGIELGRTDVWQFTLTTPELIVEEPASEAYRFAKKELNGSYHVFKDQLLLAYKNHLSETELRYVIYPINNKQKKLKNLPTLKLSSGVNTLEIDPKKLKMKKGERYILEIEDSRNQRYFLEFQFNR